MRSMGGSYRVGNMVETASNVTIRESTHKHRVDVSIVAEACSKQGGREDCEFDVFCSGRQGGPGKLGRFACSFGMEIHIRKAVGIDRKHITPVFGDPRTFLAVIRTPKIAFDVIGAHFPHSITVRLAYASHLRQVMARRSSHKDPLVLGIGRNSRLGSAMFSSVGERAREQQDENGTMLLQILLDVGLVAHNTFGPHNPTRPLG